MKTFREWLREETRELNESKINGVSIKDINYEDFGGNGVGGYIGEYTVGISLEALRKKDKNVWFAETGDEDNFQYDSFRSEDLLIKFIKGKTGITIKKKDIEQIYISFAKYILEFPNNI